MAEQDTSAAPSQEATAQPSEATQEQPSSPQFSEAEVKQWQQDSANYKKVQDYFNANPRLVDFAYKYAEDPGAQEMVSKYFSGDTSASQPEPKSDDSSFSAFEGDQKEAVMKLVDKLVQDKLSGVQSELTHLRNEHANSQIEKMSSRFTVENGYPVNFNDVRQDIANLITSGKAVDAESAYKLIVADRLPTIKKQFEDQITEEKRKASMSRYSAPGSLKIRSKQEKAKDFAEALAQAEESLGAHLGDKLGF